MLNSTRVEILYVWIDKTQFGYKKLGITFRNKLETDKQRVIREDVLELGFLKES